MAVSDLSPTQLVSASFKTVRKGYDPAEVDALLERAAKALEEAQQQATAMEARARAAVARLQELTSAAEHATAPDADQSVKVAPDEAETITRTLLLAQRTADTAIAEAQAEADRIRTEAHREAEATIDSTREMSARLLEDARVEARRTSEAERIAAENEVQSLVARREFLVGDVDQLEQFLIDQRDRLRAAARQIEALCERVPAGLGRVRPPVLSAADDPPGDVTAEQFRPEGLDAVDLGDELEPPRSGAHPVDADDPAYSDRSDPADAHDDATDGGAIDEAATDEAAGGGGAAGHHEASGLDPTQQLTLAADDDTPPAGLFAADAGSEPDDGWPSDDVWRR